MLNIEKYSTLSTTPFQSCCYRPSKHSIYYYGIVVVVSYASEMVFRHVRYWPEIINRIGCTTIIRRQWVVITTGYLPMLALIFVFGFQNYKLVSNVMVPPLFHRLHICQRSLHKWEKNSTFLLYSGLYFVIAVCQFVVCRMHVEIIQFNLFYNRKWVDFNQKHFYCIVNLEMGSYECIPTIL